MAIPWTTTMVMLLLAGPPTREIHDAAHADHDVGCPLHWNNLLGAKAIGVAALPHEQPPNIEGQAGVGLLYERTLVRGWLELELSTNALVVEGGRGAHLPIDVLLKKPFHVGHRIDPYIGAGAAVTFGLGEERFVGAGAVATVGTYFWVHPRVGLLAEIDYAAVVEPRGWQHELEFGSGPVFRF